MFDLAKKDEKIKIIKTKNNKYILNGTIYTITELELLYLNIKDILDNHIL